MSEIEKRSIAEALILASPEPIPVVRLAKLIPRCTPAKARGLVDELNAEYVKEWPNITQKGEPPADAKEWDGKPDKFEKYFSPKPGSSF